MYKNDVLFNQAINFFLWHVCYSHLVEMASPIESESRDHDPTRILFNNKRETIKALFIFNVLPMSFIQASHVS